MPPDTHHVAGGLWDPGLAPPLAEAQIAAARPLALALPEGGSALLEAFKSGQQTPSGALAELRARASAHPRAREWLWSEIEADTAAADAAWAEERARPLEGLPFAVKAIIDVAGAPVTCGSWATEDRIATADAPVVARLRAAGAIPVAMAATSEFAAGSPFNPRHGTVTNPWDASRWTGGSSTGSGGALAAGLIPFALGTDTGGSIRVPSAWCGTTGLKPTKGLVPLGGVATLSWTLDHCGPMARSAAELALVLPHMTDLPAGPLPASGWRIGVPEGWFDEMSDPAVLDAWAQGLAELQAAGATLVPFRTPEHLGDMAAVQRAAWDVLLAECAATQAPLAPWRDRQDRGLVARIAEGEGISAARYLTGLQTRSAFIARMMALMEGLVLDLLCTPGLGGEAGALSDLSVQVGEARLPFQTVISRNTMPFNLTGQPALMLPTGRGTSGLPVAMQLVGRHYGDGTCLAAGMAFQARTAHHLRSAPPW